MYKSLRFVFLFVIIIFKNHDLNNYLKFINISLRLCDNSRYLDIINLNYGYCQSNAQDCLNNKGIIILMIDH